ncbi:MAG: glycosyltransferase family 4 protein [Candidatus Helarchaeota archaeon]|nr:glycosyltransferase family 4 protein [Candidatus Helarchaeota archaeon]
MWRLCKSLEDELKIEVLTTKSLRKSIFRIRRIDSTLLSKIQRIKIHRMRIFRLDFLYKIISWLKINPRFIIPEYSFGWLMPSIKKGRKILKNSRFDYILGVYPNLTSMLSSYILSKITKTPLIIDLHDLFYDCYEKDLPAPKYKKFYLNLERKILSHASMISVITQQVKKLLIIKHQLTPENIVVIPNNVDLNEFKSIKINQKQEFVISYVGNLTDYHLEGILLLINAINKLKKENSEFNLKFQIVGPLIDKIKKKISEIDEYNLIKTFGFVNKSKSNSITMNSDILYLTLSPTHKYALEMRSTIPSKLFEYISCGKPILAYLPKGSAQKLITENNLGFVLTEYDIDKLANLILELYNNSSLYDKFSKNSLELAKKYDAKIIYNLFFKKILSLKSFHKGSLSDN